MGLINLVMTVISMREIQSSWLSVVCKMPSKKISSYLPKFFSFQFYVGVMQMNLSWNEVFAL